MTLATLGPVSSNFIVSGFALTVVLGFVISAILWKHDVQAERHEDAIAAHDQQLATLAYQMPALLEYLGVEIAPPVEDDSPEAEEIRTQEPELIAAFEFQSDDAPTDEFPIVQPDTSPMPLVVEPTPAVQARRDAAWDDPKQRPSPVPRTESDEAKARKAAWVEAELVKIRARIAAAREAS